MAKLGRPKVRKAELKKPFPMRFSDEELSLFTHAAGQTPLREWMREALMTAALVKRATGTTKLDPTKSGVMIVRGHSESSNRPPGRASPSQESAQRVPTLQ